jgi:hypothetical protein
MAFVSALLCVLLFSFTGKSQTAFDKLAQGD